MEKEDKRIIDQIINVNFTNQTKFLEYNEQRFTFILVEKAILIEGNKDDWKILSQYDTYEDNLGISPQTKMVLNHYCIKVNSTVNLNKIKLQNDDKGSAELRKTIQTYFLEGGTNLHVIEYNESFVLSELYKYSVGIILFNETTKINKFIENNSDSKIFYILANKPATQNIFTFRVFYLETEDKSWLAHPAAYLNNLSLKKPIKDYNFTRVKSFTPAVNMKLDNSYKNYIVNIGGNGVSYGGELFDGTNLVSSYVLVLLEEQIKVALFNILINKPLRSEIVGKVYNTLSNILNNFYILGALSEEVYRDTDYRIQYDGEEYVVCEYNELIRKGYKIHIVDIQKSTQSDRFLHKMTPVTLVLMLQQQIRFIQLNVEVI